MADYSAARTVIGASREELIAIFRWVHAKGENPERPVTVLIVWVQAQAVLWRCW